MSRRTARAALLLAALCATAASAAPAQAATVEVRNLQLGADSEHMLDERDRIVVVHGDRAPSAIVAGVAHEGGSDAVVTVRDDAAPLSPGAGCAALDARTVRCTADGMRPRILAALRGGADAFVLEPGQTWQHVEVWGGSGADVIDVSGATHFRASWQLDDAEDATETWDLFGGGGDDRVTSGADGDWLFGGPGSDVIHGGAGDDTIEGRGGANRLFGEAGDDRIAGGKADLVDDGGPGDDTLAAAARIAVACGEGEDVMAPPEWIAEAPAPGPLFGPDCEQSESLPMRPAVAGGVATFTWTCPSWYRIDPCTRPVTLRWDGAVAGTGRFIQQRDGSAGVARVPLSAELRAALAAGPVEVAVTVPDVEFEQGLDVIITKWVRWRVVLPASA